MITTLTAFFIDCIIGDPKSRFHPVAVMGAAISALERFFLWRSAFPVQPLFLWFSAYGRYAERRF